MDHCCRRRDGAGFRDPGRGRDAHLECPAHPEPDRGECLSTGRRVVHLGPRVYGRRVVHQRQRHDVTLAQRWMGAVWMPTRTPAGAAYSELSGVSCTSATACTAVGDYNYAAVAERWNGTVWRIQPTPTSGIGTTLDGVSCTSATACTAVGSYLTGADGTEATLAERWNGTAWKIQPTPNPGGPTDSYLSGVSCA